MEFSIQLVFSNFYIGIALGALDYASKYTVSSTRAWPYGGDVRNTWSVDNVPIQS